MSKMAASMKQAVLQLSRLRLGSSPLCRNITTQAGPLAFRATAPVAAEPMKKKKKMDINIVIQRETKKKRRLEKAIRRLESKGRKLKPVEEIEGDRQMLKTVELRQREPPVLSFEESERRALLQKKWCTYSFHRNTAEMNTIEKMFNSQRKALDELRTESEELYQAAIQVDPKMIPLERKGPVYTPPIPNYEAPDGEYIDTTKVFDK